MATDDPKLTRGELFWVVSILCLGVVGVCTCVYGLTSIDRKRRDQASERQIAHEVELLEIRLIGCELTELDEVDKTATFGCDIDKPDLRISQDYARRLGRLK